MLKRRIAAEDQLAIHDLLARYCFYLDQGDGHSWANLFADNGAFHGRAAEPVREYENLRAVPEAAYQRHKGMLRHQMTAVILEPGTTADEVSIRCGCLVTDWQEGDHLHGFAEYQAAVVEMAGDWKIQSIYVHLLTQPG